MGRKKDWNAGNFKILFENPKSDLKTSIASFGQFHTFHIKSEFSIETKRGGNSCYDWLLSRFDINAIGRME